MEMEVSGGDTSERLGGQRPSSFWIVEWIQIKELTTEWSEFKKSSIKSPDPCEFYYNARINVRNGLDIQVVKRNTKPARANITVSFIDMSVDKMIKLYDWTVEHCFHNIIKPDLLQEVDRVHIMVLNVWYGFIDEMPPPPSKQMYPGFEYFYLNEELSDFKIIIDDQTLPVHKFLLAASSREFLKMFVTPMKESQENRVVIEDIELPVMKEVLRYIYTKETSALNDVHMALSVLVVAEKYGLETLKHVCQSKLYKQLSIDNALLILDFADMYNAVQLRKFTINFLSDNKKRVASRVEFRELYHRKPELLFDFITMALKD
ncbi:ARM REPEAT PROTEIN INTERACTING WITH ABF2 isoform X2 [Diachasma alloeum]|uniref:ARM REPEAT PROTEIN INTERACTING WITH ABF2 isoform X2 n=1 Tax=Diachasma alloeum TaxID=454923 RepID=UPI00073817B3|nr:ARM REPEAT PROTEIN INTERACTING WITH ABF2 isoform X2 [Diachasma alloeum]